MRHRSIIALVLFSGMTVGLTQGEAASASKPGAAEYEFCVKHLPKKLRYKGQPMRVRTGCHRRLLVFSSPATWEVEGEPGWNGSYLLTQGEVFVFSGNNAPLCALTGSKTESGYGGLILLNESTQPGKIDCVQQGESWYTKKAGA